MNPAEGVEVDIVVLIGVTRANVATLMRSLKRKVALDDDEVQVKVPPVVVKRLIEEAPFTSSVVESFCSTVVSFCRQLF